ncbi:hypothetical protein GOL31_02835 [Sinorhizobium medicae]|nr:hypothetical protein [Sinorhizobium meliloti]MDX1110746.1 hypothetical protein [Sinorhizobium medicae]
MDIAHKIRDQIAHHRAEILRLESALEVIDEVTGKPAKAEKPMITIRKTVDYDAPAAPKQRPKPNRSASRKLEGRIMDDLRANGPSHSRDVQKRLGVEKKAVWNRLYAMKERGTIIREGDLYRMPDQSLVSEPAAVEAA